MADVAAARHHDRRSAHGQKTCPGTLSGAARDQGLRARIAFVTEHVSMTDGVAIQPIDHILLNGDPAGPALDGRSGSYSYGELEQALGRLAAWLAGFGLERGARVASWMAKGPVAALMPLAAPRAGLVHVPAPA